MAPEQVEGRLGPAGPATDVYGLGAILYEVVTGRPPFWAESPVATLLQVKSAEPVRPSRLRPEMPRDLETICLKCLQKEPRKRYASAEALADDLDRFLTGTPIQARPSSLAEQALKWARRRPALAASLAALLLVTLLGAVVIAGQWQQTQDALADEANARREAVLRAKQAEQAQQAATREQERSEIAAVSPSRRPGAPRMAGRQCRALGPAPRPVSGRSPPLGVALTSRRLCDSAVITCAGRSTRPTRVSPSARMVVGSPPPRAGGTGTSLASSGSGIRPAALYCGLGWGTPGR